MVLVGASSVVLACAAVGWAPREEGLFAALVLGISLDGVYRGYRTSRDIRRMSDEVRRMSDEMRRLMRALELRAGVDDR